MIRQAIAIFIAAGSGAYADAPAPAKKTSTQEEKVSAIDARKTALESEISALNRNRDCSGDGECEVIDIGFRLCGGPSSHLIASHANPQMAKLKAKIAEHIAVEKEMNLVNPPNDCTPAPSAPEAACVKGACQTADKK